MTIAPLIRLACVLALLTSAITASGPAAAVVILDSTWKAEGGSKKTPAAGFGAALRLAAEPQFRSVLALSTDGETWGEASSTWIGNDAKHGYLLTSAHIFDDKPSIDDYVARAPDGHVVKVDKLWIQPHWDGHADTRTGYDFAILRLAEPIVGAGPQPMLYSGAGELGQLVTFVGFGNRGIGTTGEADEYYEGSDKAAAQGVVDVAEPAVRPVPKTEEAGNYLTIALPKEDGSVEVPTGGGSKPANRLVGLLGSGDSGGSAWMKVGANWVVVAVNANGTGKAQYGDTSSFARVALMRDWILGIFPGAVFGEGR